MGDMYDITSLQEAALYLIEKCLFNRRNVLQIYQYFKVNNIVKGIEIFGQIIAHQLYRHK